jgi:hypothetical protein
MWVHRRRRMLKNKINEIKDILQGEDIVKYIKSL